MIKNIVIPQNSIAEFCRCHRIRRLALFGSVLRDDFRPESDVDVLVEFEPGIRVGFFKLYDLEQELSRILGGRKIGVSTRKSLSQYFRDQVLSEAEVLYDQA